MEKRTLEINDVVQLSPEVGNPKFAGCFMVVSEPKGFGAQGYVQVPGEGQAYYRANWSEMEYVGRATFVLSEKEEAAHAQGDANGLL